MKPTRTTIKIFGMSLPAIQATLVVCFWVVWVTASLGRPTSAQATEPQAKQQEAIENLEELLGQYDQGEYANQTSELAAAQARITELETALSLLSKQYESLQAEHAALQERCSQP